MTVQHPGDTGSAAQTLAGLSGASLRSRRVSPAPPARRPHPLVAVVVGGSLLAGVVGSVALPVLLGSRSEDASASLRTQLTAVAHAQDAYRDEHGTYTDALGDLTLPTTGHDVALVRAGADGFCVGAYDDGTGTALFYSPANGFTDTSCG